MDHLIGLGDRIVRAKRIVRDIEIQIRQLGNLQSLLDGTRSWALYHASSDYEEVRLFRFAFVNHFDDWEAHDIYAAYIEVLVCKLWNRGIGILFLCPGHKIIR